MTRGSAEEYARRRYGMSAEELRKYQEDREQRATEGGPSSCPEGGGGMSIVGMSVVALAFFGFGWSVGTLVRDIQERKRAERARQWFLKAVEETTREFVERMGGSLYERVDPSQIRLGEDVLYEDADGQHVHYTAAHHGDAGGQDHGEWYRKES